MSSVKFFPLPKSESSAISVIEPAAGNSPNFSFSSSGSSGIGAKIFFSVFYDDGIEKTKGNKLLVCCKNSFFFSSLDGER